jgi:hypothetical protein
MLGINFSWRWQSRRKKFGTIRAEREWGGLEIRMSTWQEKALRQHKGQKQHLEETSKIPQNNIG